MVMRRLAGVAVLALSQENIAAGANLTSVCFSSWPAASYAAPDSVEIPRDVLRAIVDASHAAHRPVTAHAISRGAALDNGQRDGRNTHDGS